MTTDECRAPKQEPDSPEPLEILAEKARYTAMGWLTEEALEDAVDFRALVDTAMGGLRVELRSFVLAVPKERIKVNERYPRDWWQAFRERWFPQWWLRRWPVDYREIDVDVPKFGAVCPHSAAVPFEEHMEFLASQERAAAKAEAAWRAALLGVKQTTEDTEK